MQATNAFTVKHVTPSGDMVFYASDEVLFRDGTAHGMDCLEIARADGGRIYLSDGHAYLMNAQGRTIEQFHSLGAVVSQPAPASEVTGACSCIGQYGPNPDCGLCHGDGEANTPAS